ncbi:HesA/MoeB/ThiF family protein [Streptomyces sp. P9-A4]|uniref:HesA/MoeB/ThiF family protein n=1 Tax=Streptomyces sp. P9-A4 TaxID=3072285 RepID=UPI002FCA64B9
MRRLREGTTREALGAAWRPGAATALLAELRELGWVTGEPAAYGTEFAGESYERQVDYLGLFTPDTGAAQHRLLTARVGVIGLGGIGGIVAQHLAAAGVGRFWLVDDDRVALHNLNRQFTYTRSDLGRPKTEALADYLGAIRAGAEIVGVRRRIATTGDLAASLPEELDLVVVAADTPPGLPAVVADWAARTGTPTAIGAVAVGVGLWGPVVDPARGGCWTCSERARRAGLTDHDREFEDRSTEPAPFSFGPANTVVAAMLAHDIVEFLCSGTCPTLGRRAALDFTRQQITHSEESTCTCPTTS